MICPPGRHAFGAGTGDVVDVGIGNVQRSKVAAVVLAPVDGVGAFGRLLVPFPVLVSSGASAKRDAVGLQERAAGHKVKATIALVDDDAIGPNVYRKRVHVPVGPQQGTGENNANTKGAALVTTREFVQGA